MTDKRLAKLKIFQLTSVCKMKKIENIQKNKTISTYSLHMQMYVYKYMYIYVCICIYKYLCIYIYMSFHIREVGSSARP